MLRFRFVSAMAITLGIVAVTPGLSAQVTVAERTKGMKTSSHAQVLAFLDTLIKRAPKDLRMGPLATTTEGKMVPYVVAARPMVATPAAAKATGKPVIYIEANIHSGEVEGKEAMLAMLRELTVGSLKPLLDSVILIVIPDYNADGNDKFGQERRGSQEGQPDSAGTRNNAMRINLNRDFVRAATPETKGTLALVSAWDPDLYFDLHTSNGSYHGYGLTYAPGLNPNPIPANMWMGDTVIPKVRNQLRNRHLLETFSYGNFKDQSAPEKGWDTYESYPRYGSNLMGLSRMSVLTEAFSHDPFLTRIKSTNDFVLEILRYMAEHKADVRRVMKATAAFHPDSVVLRTTFAPPHRDTVIAEVVTQGGQAAGGRGFAPNVRSGKFVSVESNVVDRFIGTLKVAMPEGYFLDGTTSDTVVKMLRRQGIVVERLTADWSGAVQQFMVDTLIAQRANEGVATSLANGNWGYRGTSDTIKTGSYFVPTRQRYGVLAAFLLEPASEDGYGANLFFGPAVKAHSLHPVRRVMSVPNAKRTLVPWTGERICPKDPRTKMASC